MPSSPTANAASARNTAVAGEVLSLLINRKSEAHRAWTAALVDDSILKATHRASMQRRDLQGCLQGEYCLSYGAVGTRVALIASEPITGQAGDWVAVPHNTALVVISEKVRLA